MYKYLGLSIFLVVLISGCANSSSISPTSTVTTSPTIIQAIPSFNEKVTIKWVVIPSFNGFNPFDYEVEKYAGKFDSYGSAYDLFVRKGNYLLALRNRQGETALIYNGKQIYRGQNIPGPGLNEQGRAFYTFNQEAKKGTLQGKQLTYRQLDYYINSQKAAQVREWWCVARNDQGCIYQYDHYIGQKLVTSTPRMLNFHLSATGTPYFDTQDEESFIFKDIDIHEWDRNQIKYDDRVGYPDGIQINADKTAYVLESSKGWLTSDGQFIVRTEGAQVELIGNTLYHYIFEVALKKK